MSVEKLLRLTPSGQISISDINTELGTTGERSLGQADGRALAGVPTGEISLSDYQDKTAEGIFEMTAGTYDDRSSGTGIVIIGYSEDYEIGELLGSYHNENIEIFDYYIYISGSLIASSLYITISGNYTSNLIGGTVEIEGSIYTIVEDIGQLQEAGYLYCGYIDEYNETLLYTDNSIYNFINGNVYDIKINDA